MADDNRTPLDDSRAKQIARNEAVPLLTDRQVEEIYFPTLPA